ncbi:MAG: exosortase/archaeosortase family protein [Chloroflexi bacterium]|nr:exosortase/archaeosortase family protein [Chloroflexota bacterium]
MQGALARGRGLPGRLLLFAVLSAALAGLWYGTSLQAMAAVARAPWSAAEEGLVHRWGVLGLCLVWLWLKRRVIGAGMRAGPHRGYAAFGLACLLTSPLWFSPGDLLLAMVGVFALVFGRGAAVPALLLGIYSFAVVLPVAVEQYAAEPYAGIVAAPAALVLDSLGYALVRDGLELRFATASGEALRVSVTAACAGPATMGLFLALFALMLLDRPLPAALAVPVFLVGVVGTWCQTLVRTLVLVLTGHYFGLAALWSAHEVSGYLLFSAWYAAFAVFYLHQAQREHRSAVALPARA